MNNTDKEILDLIENIRQGEEHGFYDLYKRYKPLIEAKVSEFSHALEPDEIHQISSIGLFHAAMSYDTDRADKITFGLYAEVCIKNRLISELRRIKPLGELSEDLPEETTSPEESFIRREDLSTRIHKAKSLLTPYERKVFGLYLCGKSYGEIAVMTGKSVKSVDNALSRIRAKFRNSPV